MRNITDIIIHEADTPDGKDFHTSDIDAWHVERGFQRQNDWRKKFNPDLKAIGYHYVIPLNGMIETGRHRDEIGAHCQGANSSSIGICLIGQGRYSSNQWQSLAILLESLLGVYPEAVIKGHYEYDSAKAQGKTCPDFDVPLFVANEFVPYSVNRLVEG